MGCDKSKLRTPREKRSKNNAKYPDSLKSITPNSDMKSMARVERRLIYKRHPRTLKNIQFYYSADVEKLSAQVRPTTPKSQIYLKRTVKSNYERTREILLDQDSNVFYSNKIIVQEPLESFEQSKPVSTSSESVSSSSDEQKNATSFKVISDSVLKNISSEHSTTEHNNPPQVELSKRESAEGSISYSVSGVKNQSAEGTTQSMKKSMPKELQNEIKMMANQFQSQSLQTNSGEKITAHNIRTDNMEPKAVLLQTHPDAQKENQTTRFSPKYQNIASILESTLSRKFKERRHSEKSASPINLLQNNKDQQTFRMETLKFVPTLQNSLSNMKKINLEQTKYHTLSVRDSKSQITNRVSECKSMQKRRPKSVRPLPTEE